MGCATLFFFNCRKQDYTTSAVLNTIHDYAAITPVGASNAAKSLAGTDKAEVRLLKL